MRRTLRGSTFWYWAGAGTLVASFLIRIVSYPVITSDYKYFVARWFIDLQTHSGLSIFAYPFADYAPLYLYLIKLLTFIPISSLASAKTLSFAFDVIIALFACAILRNIRPEKFFGRRLFFCFAVMLSIPTVLINSSLWGQSDALYGAGAMAAAYFIVVDNPWGAALALSIALCFKIQAIFFLPALVGYLWQRGRLRYLLILPALFIISIIPAWLFGGSFWYWFSIYGKQTGEYAALTINAPSVFAFFNMAEGAWAGGLFVAGIAMALFAAIGAVLLTAYALERGSMRLLLLAFLLSVLSIPFFLPRMHERYFYLADIFSVLYALYLPKRWYIPVLIVGASLLAYMQYLSKYVLALAPFVVDLRIPGGMMTAALVLMLLKLKTELVIATTITPNYYGHYRNHPALRQGG